MTRLGLLLVVLTLAPMASAQSVVERLGDLRLATAVRLALVDDVRTRALDVTVTARGGGVEVSGTVPRTDQRTVTEVATSVPGVRRVGGSAASDFTGDALTDAAAAPTVIPPRPAEVGTPESGPLYHTVERGDTLFGLARRYNTTLEAIQALNGRQSTGIQIGQRLRVR